MKTKTDVRRLRFGVAVFATVALLCSSCGSSDSGSNAGDVVNASETDSSDSESRTSDDTPDAEASSDADTSETDTANTGAGGD